MRRGVRLGGTLEATRRPGLIVPALWKLMAHYRG